MSMYSTENDNTVVTAIKQSEDGEGIVLRICDYNGENTNVNARLFDTEINTPIGHNEIKTLKITNKSTTEVNLIEY